jgi:antitoxin ParD1/3/4
MSTVEKVSIALSPELLDSVREAVASGEYGSASEVVREALREWKLRQPLRRLEVERLRAAWNEGLASGDPVDFSIDDIKRSARERFRRQGG